MRDADNCYTVIALLRHVMLEILQFMSQKPFSLDVCLTEPDRAQLRKPVVINAPIQ